METYWQAEFRKRMERFGAGRTNAFVPLSIKFRPSSGCFHREHSPEAYRIIDSNLSNLRSGDVSYKIEEHESGAEILVYLAVTTAGLSLTKSIVELITTIIKARSEGIKRGDRPSEPLELIVRGHTKNGEYVEETILRIPAGSTVTSEQIVTAFPKELQHAEPNDAERYVADDK